MGYWPSFLRLQKLKMTKKILLIIGILIVIGIAVFMIFFSAPATETGESRVGFSIRDYLPFGNSDNTSNNASTTDQNNNGNQDDNIVTTLSNQPIQELRKISNEPVAGAIVFNIGTTSVVRFVEKGTGNVYEARSDSNQILRLTNTTIPKIVRAFWLPSGSGFLAQTLMAENEIIETNFVKLNKNQASSTVESLTPYSTTIGKLPTDIKEITIKPDGSKIFYYTVSNSVSNWYVSNPDGTNSSLVASNPLTEWLPKWIAGNVVMMQNKGSSKSLGYTYSFDVSTKNFKKVGTGAAGISSNPNSDGSLSLISNGGSLPKLFLVDNKETTITAVSEYTLAEKCVWFKEKSPSVLCAVPYDVPRGDYPDVWYKGLVSTYDDIKRIDLTLNTSSDVANLYGLSDEQIDVVDISLSPDETHLIFRNKIDGYLWLLRIEE
ncbi:MAG: hypothetical protein A2431_02960 [Candidatus Zambryskibacteria bacterium RIFOXYC1_FULL_39_10]|uniref:Dipeptidylpeptidase IV N-terminal domain-containing protein n=1 Tax=Candidatus Zambryskibacteria bacterium RIFOXYC1_FULL_39_10 TaxID=1802779 RepID=A0A1G2V020_9BACT|nr:MAG: hypothetical protein A2605_02110 [Candidatus Zambryskibacteria bacterium RIFOXYD1_FULL_39_35]OHB14983.1 MAG: hypothetical protein A2431_02960 [Candidatus Zambryskibacteria bacterium RIFOXYC1_FULL_39_10]